MKFPVRKLGDLVDISSGFAFASECFGDSGDLPIIRIRDVIAGRSTTFYKGDYDPKFLVRDGDILIGMDGEFNRARWRGGPALLNQRVCRISPSNGELDDGYLFHFLPRALKAIEDATPYVTVKHLSVSDIRQIDIPLPSLSEQRRIAEILDRAEALRAKRRAALAQLDTLTQSIFLDLFGDPATNPRNWPARSFEDVCECRLGKMLDQKQQTGRDRRPYLRNANVQWFSFDLAEVFEMDFDEGARKTFRLQNGDLLICEGGGPGRAAVWKGQIEECYYQKALHRARPKANLATSEYLAWLLWFLACRGRLSDHVTSATIAHLTGEKLAVLSIPVPPLDIQQVFCRRYAAVEELRAVHQTSLSTLDSFLSVLQHRAFRGEL